jgi:hypothetical protein
MKALLFAGWEPCMQSVKLRGPKKSGGANFLRLRGCFGAKGPDRIGWILPVF